MVPTTSASPTATTFPRCRWMQLSMPRAYGINSGEGGGVPPAGISEAAINQGSKVVARLLTTENLGRTMEKEVDAADQRLRTWLRRSPHPPARPPSATRRISSMACALSLQPQPKGQDSF